MRISSAIRSMFAAALVGAALTLVPVTPAHADTLEQHVVTPRDDAYGTTMSLFDYWLSDDAARWNSDSSNMSQASFNAGINRFGTETSAWPFPWDGDSGASYANGTLHQLIFSKNIRQFTPPAAWNKFDPHKADTHNFNVWTGSAVPMTGMVKATLGEDGYPVLSENQGSEKLPHYEESLAYLFDPEKSRAGKESFQNVKGLLNVDDDGYYYYNSKENFAEFNESAKTFTLYDTPAFKGSKDGQFFPFNTANQLFKNSGGNYETSDDGELVAEVTDQTSSVINHWLGLTMITRFQQPKNGVVLSPKTGQELEMTYEFSGDDDVWVYIDDVLVGDLGGIHNEAKLKIDFRTGEIFVNGSPDGTIKSKFVAAGRYEKDDFSGNALADGSYHTLKFFYLERGNDQSNMSLKFNLLTVPASDVIKVDQNGDVLPGVAFSLYTNEADTGEDPVRGKLIASGTTDAAGDLVLKKPDGKEPLSFDELAQESTTRFVLVEESAPAGYSKLKNTIALRYIEDPNSKGAATRGGLVQDPNYDSPESGVWTTGALAMPKELVSAATTVYAEKTGQAYTHDDLKNGTLFALVYQKGKDADGKTGWYPILGGDQLEGWHVSGTAITDIDQVWPAYEKIPENDQLNFTLRPSGAYECSIEDLPGTLEDYDYWHKKGSDEEREQESLYAVGFYFRDENGTVVRLSDESFSHAFSVKIYVSNTRNEFQVQKLDDAGNALPGATFGLYEAAEDGSAPAADAEPIATVETANLSKDDGDVHNLAGGAIFGMPAPDGSKHEDAYSDVRINSGTYYVREISSPNANRYAVNETAVKVVVTDDGIFVDAGTKNDGISVVRGVGKLVKTLTQFARGAGEHSGGNDQEWSLNDTLRWIYSVPGQVAIGDDGSLSFSAWTDGGVPGAELRAGYVDEGGKVVWRDVVATAKSKLRLAYGLDTALEYGPRDKDANSVFGTDAGWLVIRSYQDERADAHAAAQRTDLSKGDPVPLSSIVTGSATIQVRDERLFELKVYKQDESGAGIEGATFTVTRVDAGAGESPFTASAVVEKHEESAEPPYALFQGLRRGCEYCLEETRVPAGYQKLEGAYRLRIDADGKAWLRTESEAGGPEHEVSVDGAGYLTITVSNIALGELPATGGPGTLGIQLAGGLLVLASVGAYLWYTRRVPLAMWFLPGNSGWNSCRSRGLRGRRRKR